MTGNVTTAEQLRGRLGRHGIFAGPPARLGIDPAALASAVEKAGFTSLWVGGGNTTPGDFEVLAAMLSTTERLVVATGIANIWAWDPAAIASVAASLESRFPGRFILGLGVSHQGPVEALGHAYARPFSKMVSFLDSLDDLDGDGLPPLVLAALGPKMLALSGERTVGAHPYFTAPGHTAQARSILGPGPLLVPEIAGSLASGEAGLAAVRPYVARYLQMPNYVNSLRSYGFSEQDVTDGGSDGLLSAVTPYGTAALLAGVRAHLDAGADHVVIQPLAPGGGFALGDLDELASAVAGLR
ncbi:MAG TPA: TIGR03620 family F420-dependent LLM class oxidoreductase [Trebonia sp.]|jgi:probable F420-dependent oxidoreductase|nr:TIGR03620 family F420-dependent LLM class oxidoreductase [Trebonia sp.]